MARILAAMSGGVDSSVAAALLAAEGHDVVGVSLQLTDHSAGGVLSRCCSPEDLRDARLVCGQLGIPYYVLNEEEGFSREVLQPFVESYRAGRTPNPCVRCNATLKFGALMETARAIGAERIATGHYARTLRDAGGRARIARAADLSKDQSYFLFDLDDDQRAAALFPVGEMTKQEVIAAAGRMGLRTSGKPESQDLCFVPGGDVRGWLSARTGTGEAGEIVDRDGAVLGRHDGALAFTVGQRRGLGIASRRPLYVLSVDPERGRVVAGPEEALLSGGLLASEVRLHDPALPARPFRAAVRIRSRHEPAPAEVAPLGGGRCRVLFDEPQRAVAPGQAAVFYEGEVLLGGGWIAAALPLEARPATGVEYARSTTERA